MDCSIIAVVFLFFFFNDTATTEIYTLSLHDALPILKNILIAGILSLLTSPLFAQKIIEKEFDLPTSGKIGRAHV